MKVYLGSDHGGYEMKAVLIEHLQATGNETVDLGTFDGVNKVDYPDIAREVGEKVLENPDARGILICGTGIGICMAAGKLKGIRAATVHDVTTARYSRLHNNAQIACLGQRVVGNEVAKDIVDVFLNTDFEGGRHETRVNKIMDIEA